MIVRWYVALSEYRRVPILLPFWSENRILTTVRITEILTRELLTGTANSSDMKFHTNVIVDSEKAYLF